MALITLRDICMSFGAEPLLDRVSLTVASRERIGLLGRNGVGKTTLTVHLAVALARQKRRVVVVDADPQGNCSSWLLDAEPAESGLFDPGPFVATWMGVFLGLVMLRKRPGLRK